MYDIFVVFINFMCVYILQYQFCVLYFEFYNEEIRDLVKGLNDNVKYDIVGVKENKMIVMNIIEKEVKIIEEVSLI